MKILVITDVRIQVTPDGNAWCSDEKHGYEYWRKYLTRFDEVEVLARTRKVASESVEGYCRCNGDKVSVISFPVINSYLFRFREVMSRLYKVIEEHECAVIEAPSVFTTLAENVAYKNRMPYILAVTADPDKRYRNNVSGRAFKNQFRMACLRANCVIYETSIAKDCPVYIDKFGPDNRHIDGKGTDVYRQFRTMVEREYTKRTEKVVRKQGKQGH